jgi:hypothetical protein
MDLHPSPDLFVLANGMFHDAFFHHPFGARLVNA